MMNLDDIMKSLLFGALLLIGAFAATNAAFGQSIGIPGGEVESRVPYDLPVAATVRLFHPEEGSVCSGTVIAPEKVLTAAHCIAHVRAVESGGKLWEITIYESIVGIDAAIVTAPGVACPCAPVSGVLVVGDEVRAVGYPSGKLSDTRGELLGITDGTRDENYPNQIDIVNTARIAPGSSGGGLWQLRDGEWVLVGVTVHGIRCSFPGVCVAYGATPAWMLTARL